MTHTPGPWEAEQKEGVWSITGRDGRDKVCFFCAYGRGQGHPDLIAEATDNAELIASAPTLKAENERLRAANERHLATHRLNIETMSVTASRLEAKDMGIYELTTAMDETRAAIKAAKGGE